MRRKVAVVGVRARRKTDEVVVDRGRIEVARKDIRRFMMREGRGSATVAMGGDHPV